MRKNILPVVSGILLLTAVGNAGASSLPQNVFSGVGTAVSSPSKTSAETKIPGEYIVMFKIPGGVAGLDGAAKSSVMEPLLGMQAEYLKAKYDVVVVKTYDSISKSSGRGMFFVRSAKAAGDAEYERKLLEAMNADPYVESVSVNAMRKMI